MQREISRAAQDPDSRFFAISNSTAWKLIWGLQLIFILTALPHLDEPFLSVHFERQNQTYDLAEHVFHDGWSAVLFPKASFSVRGYETQPFTIVRFEIPFHGVLGWPIAAFTGHDRIAVRVVSLLFAVLSISLVFLILRRWVKPGPAVIGTTLWAGAPIVLHFGQVPMPDILSVAGLLAAFYLALRGKTFGSSLCFLFAILSKESVLPFGLPVLVVLLEAKNCRSLRETILSSIAWGVLPLVGLVAWLSLDLFGPRTPWNLFGPAIGNRGTLHQLVNPIWYAKSAGCLFPFGSGIVGAIGIGWAIVKKLIPLRSKLFWAVVISCIFYFLFVVRKIDEPQYFLPVLFWVVVAASSSIAHLLARIRLTGFWVTIILTIVLAHLALTFVMASDLKASRVPDFPAIKAAGRLLPEGSRVLVAYRHYGAGPAVWLNRNVLAIPEDDPSSGETIRSMRAVGFTHLLILDVESRYSGTKASFASILREGLKALTGGDVRNQAGPGKFEGKKSAVCRFAEKNCALLYENRHVLLFRIQDLGAFFPRKPPLPEAIDIRSPSGRES